MCIWSRLAPRQEYIEASGWLIAGGRSGVLVCQVWSGRTGGKAAFQFVALATRATLSNGLMRIGVSVFAANARFVSVIELLLIRAAAAGRSNRRRLWLGQSCSAFVFPGGHRIAGHGRNTVLFAVLVCSSAARAASASALARTGASRASMLTAVACALRASSSSRTEVTTRPKPPLNAS
jgi:hypothetical protein